MKDETILTIVGIIALLIIEVAALHHGINHAMLEAIVTIIAGRTGYEVRKRRDKP